MDYRRAFKNKRITLLGLGLLGRGVGDAEFLAKCGAQVIVTDKKTETELAASVAKLKKYPNVTFRLGGHRKEDFEDCDMVLKAAGVPLDSPEIAAARAAGVPVTMSTALFAKYAIAAGAKIVGVTGTRGKTTVAHMIHHSLISAFAKASADRRAFLGGNVRGISTLSMLPDVRKGDVAVLELDSWQLQGFGDLKISPNISVFTNLMPDHQNYYKDMDEYFTDKANIFRHQYQGDALIIGKSVEEKVNAARPQVAPQIPKAIPADWELKIVGEHNRENAAFANAALQALGLSDDEIKTGLESFEGVEGRLQFVRELNGVKMYNDNNATTPEATIAALRALNQNVRPRRSNILIIIGGADKGLDMTELTKEINQNCKKVILLAGTGTDALLQANSYKLQAPVSGPFSSLSHAVQDALNNATKGDTILFSPAFASFGMFKNEYDRNDQFLEIVRTTGGAA